MQPKGNRARSYEVPWYTLYMSPQREAPRTVSPDVNPCGKSPAAQAGIEPLSPPRNLLQVRPPEDVVCPGEKKKSGWKAALNTFLQ